MQSTTKQLYILNIKGLGKFDFQLSITYGYYRIINPQNRDRVIYYMYNQNQINDINYLCSRKTRQVLLPRHDKSLKSRAIEKGWRKICRLTQFGNKQWEKELQVNEGEIPLSDWILPFVFRTRSFRLPIHLSVNNEKTPSALTYILSHTNIYTHQLLLQQQLTYYTYTTTFTCNHESCTSYVTLRCLSNIEQQSASIRKLHARAPILIILVHSFFFCSRLGIYLQASMKFYDLKKK